MKYIRITGTALLIGIALLTSCSPDPEETAYDIQVGGKRNNQTRLCQDPTG